MSTQRSATEKQQPTPAHLTKEGKHVHHGRTPAAWAGSMIATVAIVLGGLALVLQLWPMFWVAAGLLLVALIATAVLQKMGYGAY